jgi:hypothetical protein
VAPRKHQQLLTAAIEQEGEAQRELLDGRADEARTALRETADLYRQSWEAAPPRSYGRLVGMLKSSVLAGGGASEAEYARGVLADAGRAGSQSATASYVQALAALILGHDAEAQAWALAMSAGADAFKRTAEAIAALAAYDGNRYALALGEIVHDFEQRSQHLTGVAIADTALVLEVLAARRGIVVAMESPVLPAIPDPERNPRRLGMDVSGTTSPSRDKPSPSRSDSIPPRG